MKVRHLTYIFIIAMLFCAFLIKSAGNSSRSVTSDNYIALSAVAFTTEIVEPFAATPNYFATSPTAINEQLPLISDILSASLAMPAIFDELSFISPMPVIAAENNDNNEAAEIIAPPIIKNNYRDVWAIVTAYCPCTRCCGRNARGRTSIGNTAWLPGIAADPNAVSYGTRVEIPEYGTYLIDDTGGAMRRNWRVRGQLHLDVRLKYHYEARSWGKKLMKVKIYHD